MPSYKLMYFDCRGRGETTRLLFKAGGIPFEDVRISFEEWPAIKEGDACPCPYKTMPILIVDGKTTLCEVRGIIRYVGAIAGLEPAIKLDRAKADSVAFSVTDMQDEIYKIMLEKDQEVMAASLKKYKETTLPAKFKVWENFLHQCGGEFFGGKNMCYADVEFFNFVNSCLMSGANSSDVPKELKSFHSLCALYKRVYGCPKIKEHCSTRPERPF